MLRMFRFRGKRIWFLIFAACATFLIFRWSRETQQIYEFDIPLPNNKETYANPGSEKQDDIALKEEAGNEVVVSKATPTALEVVQTSLEVVQNTPSSTPPPVPTVPPQAIPDRRPPGDVNGIAESDEHLIPSQPKGRLEFPTFSATTTIHWERQSEHFPVPTESIIQLPTGEPIRIPKIQHEFGEELANVKESREKRQAKVRGEFHKAWKGYREKAWLHDEVSPVTGSFRDPFCGWAATLVDGLDTLWIMGFETEFEEALEAVSKLDFTTSSRKDIPMFETTIRYLGGLIGAYDVSGKKYKVLLDKATELADILIGAFDTPNRMPILYYRWLPAFASQPKRADTHANTAELGSMSMEFTRLAQLTQDPRYYDAVARVTDALSEWQDRGTPLDGVFPERIDASGCNRTEVPTPVASASTRGPVGDLSESPQGYQPVEGASKAGKPELGVTPMDDTVEPDEVGLEVLPGDPSKAKLVEVEHVVDPASQFRRRDVAEPPVNSNDTTLPESGNDVVTRPPLRSLPIPFKDSTRLYHTTKEDWDCKNQGLEPANPRSYMKFGMGGSQDSTYEYFPKQYLLLGGHEQKYGKMYLKTVEAVRKHMLYRPMALGDPDILFSGSVERSPMPDTELTLIHEVEHLTCFLGGLIGMSAKIFELEGDLEIAKKLADGCVWAYQSFPSGIMPEGSNVAACEDKDNCKWDEEAYYLILDPMGTDRDKLKAEYIENRNAARRKQEEDDKAAIAAAALKAQEAKQVQTSGALANASHTSAEHVADTTIERPRPIESPIGSAKLKKDEPVSLQKRDVEGAPIEKNEAVDAPIEKPAPVVENIPKEPAVESNTIINATLDAQSTDTADSGLDDSQSLNGISQHEKEYDDFVRVNEVASGREAEVPLAATATAKHTTPVDPSLPLNHKEYVKSRLEQERLPPGFTGLRSKTYILRPEAIESVWYMYRITGDTIWQDKGWKMFEAIVAATSAEFGHSAIYDVTAKNPLKIDEMESFWLAETLKYFYLLFSTPDVVSLDEWVLNTEAHPFKREADKKADVDSKAVEDKKADPEKKADVENKADAA